MQTMELNVAIWPVPESHCLLCKCVRIESRTPVRVLLWRPCSSDCTALAAGDILKKRGHEHTCASACSSVFEQGSWHFPAMQRRSAFALRPGHGGHKRAGLLLAEGVSTCRPLISCLHQLHPCIGPDRHIGHVVSVARNHTMAWLHLLF